MFGPYAHVSEGDYIISFRLKASDFPARDIVSSQADDSIATLDVNAGGFEGLNKAVTSMDLKAKDLNGSTGWQWVSLRLHWPGPPNQMEARVWWTGKAHMVLDRVALFEVPPA